MNDPPKTDLFQSFNINIVCRRATSAVCKRAPCCRSVGQSPGQHCAAVSQEPALLLHQTQTHHPCRILIRWIRVLDAAGK